MIEKKRVIVFEFKKIIYSLLYALCLYGWLRGEGLVGRVNIVLTTFVSSISYLVYSEKKIDYSDIKNPNQGSESQILDTRYQILNLLSVQA